MELQIRRPAARFKSMVAALRLGSAGTIGSSQSHQRHECRPSPRERGTVQSAPVPPPVPPPPTSRTSRWGRDPPISFRLLEVEFVRVGVEWGETGRGRHEWIRRGESCVVGLVISAPVDSIRRTREVSTA